MKYRLVSINCMLCASIGLLVISEEFASERVAYIDQATLETIRGGASCGQAATTQCEGTSTDCGTGECKRAIGTLVYTCGGGATPDFYTEYPSYDHSSSADEGYEKDEEQTEPCYVVYVCSCDEDNFCLMENDDSYGTPEQGNPSNIYPVPLTDTECPEGSGR